MLWSGLLYIKNRRVLMVREKDKDFFVLPGGKVEEGETLEQTLAREVEEELGVQLSDIKFFAVYDLPAKSDQRPGKFNLFQAELVGKPIACDDIAELAYLDSQSQNAGFKLGSISEQELFPYLKRLGLIN